MTIARKPIGTSGSGNRRHWRNCVLMLLAGLSITGCAQVQPLVSHAHIGHALTAWHDTPNQQGLLTLARQQADRALSAAKQSQGPAVSVREAREQLKQIKIALTPEVLATGGTSRYGLISAFEGAIEHLEYAVQASDASPNMITSVTDISAVADPLIQRLRITATLAAQGNVSTDSDAVFDNLARARESLRQAIDGHDANRDGQIALTATEGGLTQIEQALDSALQRERNPAYQPLARKYLFGLVRLPDGQWLFRPRNASNNNQSSGGYGN